MIAPKLARLGLFEFHRAQECFDLGRQAAERALPDIRDKLLSQGMDPFPSTADQFAALIRNDFAKYRKIIKSANIKLE